MSPHPSESGPAPLGGGGPQTKPCNNIRATTKLDEI